MTRPTSSADYGVRARREAAEAFGKCLARMADAIDAEQHVTGRVKTSH